MYSTHTVAIHISILWQLTREKGLFQYQHSSQFFLIPSTMRLLCLFFLIWLMSLIPLPCKKVCYLVRILSCNSLVYYNHRYILFRFIDHGSWQRFLWKKTIFVVVIVWVVLRQKQQDIMRIQVLCFKECRIQCGLSYSGEHSPDYLQDLKFWFKRKRMTIL